MHARRHRLCFHERSVCGDVTGCEAKFVYFEFGMKLCEEARTLCGITKRAGSGCGFLLAGCRCVTVWNDLQPSSRRIYFRGSISL